MTIPSRRTVLLGLGALPLAACVVQEAPRPVYDRPPAALNAIDELVGPWVILRDDGPVPVRVRLPRRRIAGVVLERPNGRSFLHRQVAPNAFEDERGRVLVIERPGVAYIELPGGRRNALRRP